MIKAVIFDLDGVLLSTDEYHYRAWKQLADREDIYFDRAINERLRGVSRMESLEIILERATKSYTAAEKEEMAGFKNDAYRQLLEHLTPSDVFPGVTEFIAGLQREGVRPGIGSSSKNTKYILEKVGLIEIFRGAISDGTNIVNSKPDPEVFIKAAEMMGIAPAECLVVEDAEAGVMAGKAAGMRVVGVGPAAGYPLADYQASGVAGIPWIALAV